MSFQAQIFPLQPGCECLIQGLGADPKVAQRLAQMGILPGSELCVVRTALFGHTLEVSVDGGQSIALRSDDLGQLDCKSVAFPLTLGDRSAGTPMTVRRLLGGANFLQRMGKVGIRPGAELLPDKALGWPMKLKVDGAGEFITLGRGEASKIIVSPKGADRCPR